MKQKLSLTIFFCMAFISIGFAETITLRTYLPMPSGSYEKLRLPPHDLVDSECAELADVGLLGYDTDKLVKLCKNNGGSPQWDELSGLWDHNENPANTHNIFLISNDAWSAGSEHIRIGVGTTTPVQDLHVKTKAQPGADFIHGNMTGMVFEADDTVIQMFGDGSTPANNMAHLILSTSDDTTGDNRHWLLNHTGEALPYDNRFSISYLSQDDSTANFLPDDADIDEYLTLLGQNLSDNDRAFYAGIHEPNPQSQLHISEIIWEGSNRLSVDYASANEEHFGNDVRVEGDDSGVTLVAEDTGYYHSSLRFIEVWDEDTADNDLEYQNMWVIFRTATGDGNSPRGDGNPANPDGDGGQLHIRYTAGDEDWWGLSAGDPTDIMTFNPNGNVGINVNGPTEALQFKNYDGSASSIVALEGPSPGIFWQDATATDNRYKLTVDNNRLDFITENRDTNPGIFNLTRMTLNQNGYLGIGTTTPATPLHLNSTGTQLIVEGPTPEITLFDSTVAEDDWQIEAGGKWLSIANGPDKTAAPLVNRVWLESDGDLGIRGKPPANITLNVEGAATILMEDTSVGITFLDINHGDFQFHCCNRGGTTSGRGMIHLRFDVNGDLDFSNDGSHPLISITDDRRVGIGIEEPTVALDVRGNMIASGTITQLSDARLKKEIKVIENALERIVQLRGVNYKWKDETKSKDMQMGLIAQEVEAVFPEAVFTDEYGYKSINYGRLVGALIEAIKQLEAETKNDIRALEKQADDLSRVLK